MELCDTVNCHVSSLLFQLLVGLENQPPQSQDSYDLTTTASVPSPNLYSQEFVII